MDKNIDYWSKITSKPRPIYQELFRAEAEYLAAHIMPGSSVLDIGCGDGRIIKYILPVTKDVIGLDIDPNAINLAKHKFADEPNLRLIEGDVFKLPFSTESFDVITLMLTLVNLGDRKADALKEMKRVMKSTGKIIISVYSEDAWNHRIQQYKAISLPIKEISGTKVILNEFNEGSTSEQLSLNDLEGIADRAELKVQDVLKVPGIAYIVELANCR